MSSQQQSQPQSQQQYSQVAQSQQQYSQVAQSQQAQQHKKIFITGAGGQTGSFVLKHLSKAPSQFEISAGIYAEQKENLERCVRECCPQAKTRAIDADDIDNLVEAFRGVDDLFIVPTATDQKVAHARNYIKAAKKADVKFVLLLSMTGAEARNYLFADQFRDIEETLQREQIENYCVLRSNFYMQNLLLYKDQIKQGVLPIPLKQGKFNPLDADDVGKAAQAILTDCSKHCGKWYNICGPQQLTGQEMAQAISKAANRQVQFQTISNDEARKILKNQRVPNSEAQGLLEFYKLAELGQLTEEAKNDYESIVGQKPNSLENFLKRNINELVA